MKICKYYFINKTNLDITIPNECLTVPCSDWLGCKFGLLPLRIEVTLLDCIIILTLPLLTVPSAKLINFPKLQTGEK